jgi:hypothetical protein
MQSPSAVMTTVVSQQGSLSGKIDHETEHYILCVEDEAEKGHQYIADTFPCLQSLSTDGFSTFT